MEREILKNLANWLMLEKCKEVGIDPSGSYCDSPRSNKGERTFTLVKTDSDRPFMQVTFGRRTAPRFIY